MRIRSKRKTFDQMTKYGKRKSMVDVRALLSRKQKEYMVPVSKLAGYVIQQVKHETEAWTELGNNKTLYMLINYIVL